AGSGLAFTVILPDNGQFPAIEESLGAATLENGFSALEWTDIELSLPTFEFEYAAGLSEALQPLGMTDAFDEETADFTGMVGEDPPGPLFISNVLHKAFIAVDEQGTEAAAATMVIMAEGAAPMDPVEPIEVRVDRPFIFAIRDTESGAILFLGRVLDPSE
ncbi:MAG: serpin family protein, partial [Thermomicrobiales bacterium]